MKRWTVFAVLVLGVSVLTSGVVRPDGVAAYMVCDDGECVHENIVAYATGIGTEPGEFLSYFGDVQHGAGHEDLHDHVWDISSPCTTNTHFWDADDADWNNPSDGSISCTTPNAWQKARVLWGMALGEYHSGDKNAAYEYLGHVAHLLADMTVPSHAHEDPHPFADAFEDWMTAGVAALSQSEADALVAAGPVEIPDWAPKLDWLFYTTNQVGDFYASDDDDGDSNDPKGWADFSGLNPDPECRSEDGFELGDCDLHVVRTNSYLYGIRAVAALLELFEEERKQQTDLTVVIDSVKQLQGHGATDDPDYYVWVSIGGQPFKNEGDQQETCTDCTVDPGWAFGWNVGLTGTAEVQIELWDDDDPFAHCHSDIDPDDGERNLWLTVDLDKCVAGEAGAVSGDLAGTCGVQLTSAGNEEDRSQIWFRILAPNAPPTADAGPDQTVDEGDLVTLNGSFTDPNVEDTHTFLWHLESSTNGQDVPDATTQSFSFTPIDDGVYTFSFTVTDNHGAQGSDTVVVTAENVPPDVSIDSITDQYGQEVGTDVVYVPVGFDVNLSATFDDVGVLDTHPSATIDWDDGTVYTEADFTTFTDCVGGAIGTVTATHIFYDTGTFTVVLAVVDDDGGVGTATVDIQVIDGATLLTIVIDDLRILADNLSLDPDARAALRYALAELKAARTMLWWGQPRVAVAFIADAVAFLERAEVSDPTLDLTFYKIQLAAVCKSEAMVGIAEATASASRYHDWQKIAYAEQLVAEGDVLVAAGDYLGAIGKYHQAVRKVGGPWGSFDGV